MILNPFSVSLRQSSPPSLTNHSGTLTHGAFCGLANSGGSSNTSLVEASSSSLLLPGSPGLLGPK